MNRDKLKRLETKGWKVGSADEFLELTPREVYMSRRGTYSTSFTGARGR